MKRRAIVVAAVIAALSGTARTGHADGLTLRPSELTPAARNALRKEIAAFRAEHPEVFTAVRGVEGHHREVYGQRRNPTPTVGRELRALGPRALLPMLDALAFDAPERGDLDDAEWTALTVGMLEAVGVLRDTRSGPVLAATFEGAKGPRVAAAAARALGRLCGDAELAVLIGGTRPRPEPRDARRMAAIEGLGECKRIESARQLAALLAADDGTLAGEIAAALGRVGSSWAWEAMGPRAQRAGLAVREVAARALVSGFVRHGGAARRRIAASLGMVAHPATPELISEARAGADPETAKALDALTPRLSR